MIVADLIREAERNRKLFKTVDDLETGLSSGVDAGSEKSDEQRAMELLTLLHNVDKNYDEAKNRLRAAKAQIVNGLSPQARQILRDSGDEAYHEMGRLEEVRSEIEKRLLVLGDARKKTTLAKALDRHVRELRALQKRAADVEAGRERLDPVQRRELVAAISRAELRVRACMQ